MNLLYKNFLPQFFSILNKRDVKYCLLNDYYLTDFRLTNDIDILVTKADFKNLVSILNGLISEYNLNILHEYNCGTYRAIWIIHEMTILHIDFWCEIAPKMLKLIDTRKVIARRRRVHQIYCVTDVDAILIGTIKDLVRSEIPKLKYQKLYSDLSKNDKILIENEQLYSVTFFNIKDWKIKNKVSYLQLVLFSLRKYKISSAVTFLKIFLNKIVAVYSNKPMVLGFSGPDGSGKTTIINAIETELIKSFYVTRNIHGEINFLPSIQSICKLFRTKKDVYEHNSRSGANAIQNKKPIKPLFLFPFISYKLCNLFLMKIYFRFVHPKRVPILLDRYFVDYFVLPEYSNLNIQLFKIFELISPSVNIHYVMYSQPEIIAERKNELSVRNIATQYSKFDKLQGQYKRFAYISTSKAFYETIDQVFKYMNKSNS